MSCIAYNTELADVKKFSFDSRRELYFGLISFSENPLSEISLYGSNRMRGWRLIRWDEVFSYEKLYLSAYEADSDSSQVIINFVLPESPDKSYWIDYDGDFEQIQNRNEKIDELKTEGFIQLNEKDGMIEFVNEVEGLYAWVV